YLDVIPVCETEHGVRVEGSGEAVEWAVKMRRLPESATLESRLLAGTLDVPLIQAVARKIAEFHADPPPDVVPSTNATRLDAEITQHGLWTTIVRNVMENFEQA